VIPAWLGEVLPGDGQFTFVHARTGGAPKQWSSGALSLTAKGICQTCNHWFGAEVEDTARPMLTRMIRGDEHRIDVRAQIVISTWAAKTAAMAELTDDAPLRLAARTGLPTIRTTRCAPASVGVWAGEVMENFETVVVLQQVSTGRITLPTGEEFDGANWFQTFRLGRLALQVAGHTYPTAMRVETDRDKTGAARRIWPIQHDALDWPPARAMSDAEFIGLTHPTLRNSPANVSDPLPPNSAMARDGDGVGRIPGRYADTDDPIRRSGARRRSDRRGRRACRSDARLLHAGRFAVRRSPSRKTLVFGTRRLSRGSSGRCRRSPRG
jgi:hypothetical protein